MDKKLRIGIVGAGRIGSVHAETLAFRLPEAAPMVIADINANAAAEVAKGCGIPRVVPTPIWLRKPRGLGSTSSVRARSTTLLRKLISLSGK